MSTHPQQSKNSIKQLSFVDYLKPSPTRRRLASSTSDHASDASVISQTIDTSRTSDKVTAANLRVMRSRRIHGGELRTGRRKIQRPIAPKKWMHLTLKSSVAKGDLSLLHIKHRYKIQKLIHMEARKNFITIGDGVNMGNHFHLKMKCQSRKYFQTFLRSITGKIARLVTGAQKGKPFGKRFWDMLAFSRVLTSTYEVFLLNTYLNANRKERSYGYQARQRFLNDFNLWMKHRLVTHSKI